MGQVFRFTCDCGYATEVHGGPGGIFAIELATVTRSDCQEVLDIGLGPWDEYPVIHGGSSREEKLKTRKEAMQMATNRFRMSDVHQLAILAFIDFRSCLVVSPAGSEYSGLMYG